MESPRNPLSLRRRGRSQHKTMLNNLDKAVLGGHTNNKDKRTPTAYISWYHQQSDPSEVPPYNIPYLLSQHSS
jgi:hypothetical protein